MIVEDGTGLENADSYISVAEADSELYLTPYKESWDTLDETAKEYALIKATKRLKSVLWYGEKLTTTQALDWPRQCCYNYFTGEYVETNVIPDDIKTATAFLAGVLVAYGVDEFSGNIKRVKIPDLEVEYSSAYQTSITHTKGIPVVVKSFVSSYGEVIGDRIR